MSALGALGLHALLTAVTLAVALTLAWLLRERSTRPPTPAYEGGVLPTGGDDRTAAARYTLIAALFVIFDAEAAILIVWAVAAREAGVAGLIEATIFAGVLLAALAYLWADGALEVGPEPRGSAGTTR